MCDYINLCCTCLANNTFQICFCNTIVKLSKTPAVAYDLITVSFETNLGKVYNVAELFDFTHFYSFPQLEILTIHYLQQV